MSNPIKIAIFGVGRWGVHLVRNFRENPHSEIVAIADPHPERLAAVRQQFHLDQHILLTTDSAAVINFPDLEAVAIATPASTHYSLIKAALEKGHHVLAEKPLTLDPQESLELCQLAEKQQRQLIVDHTYLFHPAIERGKVIIQQQRLGTLRYGYASRTHLGPIRQDVDVLWDLAIHDIAIFNTWVGEKLIQVQANSRTWLPDSQLADLVWITLTYTSGFQAFIHLCWLNPDKQRRLAIAGTQGTLIFDEMSPENSLTFQPGQVERNGNVLIPTTQNLEILNLEPMEPLRVVCNHFLDCARENITSPISSGWVGTELVSIVSALSQSLQQGGFPVTLPANQF